MITEYSLENNEYNPRSLSFEEFFRVSWDTILPEIKEDISLPRHITTFRETVFNIYYNVSPVSKLAYEDFFEEVWDYVSPNSVNDDMWDSYEEIFQEITFDFYQLYKKSDNTFSTKLYARMIESFVNNFSKLFI